MTETKKELIPQDCVLEKNMEKKFFNFSSKLFKNIFAILFLPLYLILGIFENKTFSRILKQLIFFSYFFFVIIFIYTLIMQNNGIKNSEKVIVEIKYKDKIKDIE